MPTLSPQSVRRLSRSPTFARSPARSKQVKALLASYSRPPHRRNLFFRAVETAAAQETAVLETHRFLRARRRRRHKKPAHRHTPHARPTHPMRPRALQNTMAHCCASRPSTEASRTLAFHRQLCPAPGARVSLTWPGISRHPAPARSAPSPLLSPVPFRAPFSRGAHSPTHRSSPHHWSTPWVRGESSHATRPFSLPPVCLAA